LFYIREAVILILVLLQKDSFATDLH